MPNSALPIIATGDRPAPAAPVPSLLPWWCAAAALAWGTVAAIVYAHLGLTLSHYDAKAHLVVARRVMDSLTPGWRQLGGVWLPLPHLLNLLPVQIDVLYRTGASAVAISIASMALAAGAAARLVLDCTASRAAAVLAAGLLLANPNLLYLQSTPMTEPLLIGLLLLSALAVERWVASGSRTWLRRSGWAIAAATFTRYEAWPFTAALFAAAAIGHWRLGRPWGAIARDLVRLACYPAAAIAVFLLNSRLSTGVWFVTGGFYVPDPRLRGKAIAVTASVLWGARQLGSMVVGYGGAASTIALAVIAWRSPRRTPTFTAVALAAVALLPWYAFYVGHPFRIRYMVPVVVADIVALSLAIGLLPARVRTASAAAAFALVLLTTRPFDPRAAMVVEAQWDVPDSRGRAHVTSCLAARHPGEVVMASMGSLAHYMQELSRAGFEIRDFVHEGNGEIWNSALRAPRKYVGWVLVEEKAEGGDVLAARAARDPSFLEGFTRICEGGGVALYRIDQGLPVQSTR